MGKPAEKRTKKQRQRSEHCLACGAKLHGEYCHVCGQKNDDCRRSIGRLAAETVANVAAIDGKFLRTVRSSLVRPGKHLHQYAHGRRSPFTPPVRFFFVVTFAFFASLWMTDKNIFLLQLVPEDPDDAVVAEGNINFTVDLGEGGDEVAEKSANDGEAPAEPDMPSEAEEQEAPTAQLPEMTLDLGEEGNQAVAELRSELRMALEEEGVDVPGFLQENESSGTEPEVPTSRDPPTESETEELAAEAAVADEMTIADDAAEPVAAEEEDAPADPAPRIVPYGGFLLQAQDITYTEDEKEWLRSRVQLGDEGGVTFMGRELNSERLADALIVTMQNPNAFNNALNEAIPALMLIFVPLMALLGAMFIRGRDALVYDHLLLAIQTHAFAFVVLTALLWVGFTIPSELSFLIFLLAMPVYYVLGLRGAFKRGWFHSIFTTIFVGAVYHTLFFFALLAAVLFSLWQIV